MLPLPWWILGVGPEEDINEDSDHDSIDGAAVSTAEESTEGITPTTPLSIFRTPSASPFIDVPDQLPKVIEFSTFLNAVKRRSSSRLERSSPKKICKAEKRSSLVRNETEIMNKSADGQSILGYDETFGIAFDTEPVRCESPMPMKDVFNQTFNILEDEKEVHNEDISSEESPKTRDFPMFFSSFDDTTVLFNSTITGDIDMNEKNDAVGKWIFKNSDFRSDANTTRLETDAPDANDVVFKEPIKNTKKRGRPIKTSEKATSSKRAATAKGNKEPEEKEKQLDVVYVGNEPEKETETSSRTTPSLTRRHTPSRKAKTYKSLRE